MNIQRTWAMPNSKTFSIKPIRELIARYVNNLGDGIIEAVGEVRTFGCKKYGCPENWKTVKPELYVDALMRHLVRYLRDPKSVDEESGLSHLAHMATNIAFLIEMENGA